MAQVEVFAGVPPPESEWWALTSRTVDGQFGWSPPDSDPWMIREFQLSVGLEADGVCGPKTMAAIATHMTVPYGMISCRVPSQLHVETLETSLMCRSWLDWRQKHRWRARFARVGKETRLTLRTLFDVAGAATVGPIEPFNS